MKYFKITLNKNPKGEFIYPDNYQEEVGNFATDYLYFDEDNQSYLLLCIPNVKSGAILRNNIEEINESDVKAISEEHETKIEIVTDEIKLRRIELKAKLAQPLSIEEINAIDIEHPDSIFKKVEILSDRIEKNKKNK